MRKVKRSLFISEVCFDKRGFGGQKKSIFGRFLILISDYFAEFCNQDFIPLGNKSTIAIAGNPIKSI